MECPKCGSENITITSPTMIDETSVEATLLCRGCGQATLVSATFETPEEY